VLDDEDAGAEGHGGSDDRIANNENLTEKLSQDYQFHLRSGIIGPLAFAKVNDNQTAKLQKPCSLPNSTSFQYMFHFYLNTYRGFCD